MALDLLKVEPHRVKAGVQGKMFLFYGGPKTGKTVTACQFDRPLLLAFEPGYNLIDGIEAVMVTSWLDMKNYIKQLKKPEVREKYNTIIIDTADLISESKYYLKWSNNYKEACKLIYDKNSKLEDFQKAEQLLLTESQNGNVLATHDLGKLYSTDKLGEKDLENLIFIYIFAKDYFTHIKEIIF